MPFLIGFHQQSKKNKQKSRPLIGREKRCFVGASAINRSCFVCFSWNNPQAKPPVLVERIDPTRSTNEEPGFSAVRRNPRRLVEGAVQSTGSSRTRVPRSPPPSGPPSSKTNADRFSRTKKEPTVELDLLIGCLQVAGPKKNSIYANTWIDFALILFSLVSFGVGGSIESLKRNAAVSLYLCLWK